MIFPCIPGIPPQLSTAHRRVWLCKWRPSLSISSADAFQWPCERRQRFDWFDIDWSQPSLAWRCSRCCYRGTDPLPRAIHSPLCDLNSKAIRQRNIDSISGLSHRTGLWDIWEYEWESEDYLTAWTTAEQTLPLQLLSTRPLRLNTYMQSQMWDRAVTKRLAIIPSLIHYWR